MGRGCEDDKGGAPLDGEAPSLLPPWLVPTPAELARDRLAGALAFGSSGPGRVGSLRRASTTRHTRDPARSAEFAVHCPPSAPRLAGARRPWSSVKSSAAWTLFTPARQLNGALAEADLPFEMLEGMRWCILLVFLSSPGGFVEERWGTRCSRFASRHLQRHSRPRGSMFAARRFCQFDCPWLRVVRTVGVLMRTHVRHRRRSRARSGLQRADSWLRATQRQLARRVL